MASLVILDKDASELEDINAKIQNDGLKPDLCIDHKLRYLWRCLQRAESSLKSALDDVESLRRQHAEEMIEVENYVTHIRQLSEEREFLTFEFESENEQLKAEVEELKQEQQSMSILSELLSKVLSKKGLTGCTMLSKEEQMTKLSIEIEKDIEKILVLETENERLKSEGSSISSKMLEIMDTERTDMEKDLQNVKQKHESQRAADKAMYEEELTKVKEEKANLQNVVNENEGRLRLLSSELMQTQQTLAEERESYKAFLADMQESYEAKYSSRPAEINAQESEDSKVQSQIKKLQSEVASLTEQLSAVIEEKRTLKEMISQLEDDLWAEKQNWDLTYHQSQAALAEERNKLLAKVNDLEVAESKCLALEKKNHQLEEKANQLSKDLERMNNSEAIHDSLQKADNELLSNKLIELTGENKALSLRLVNSESCIQRHLNTIEELNSKINQKDVAMKETVEILTCRDTEHKSQLSNLYSKLKECEMNLATARQEKEAAARYYEETMSGLKGELVSCKARISVEQQEKRALEAELGRLEGSLADLQKRVLENADRSTDEDRKMAEEVKVILEEKEQLKKEREEKEESRAKQEAEFNSLRQKARSLSEERTSLEQTMSLQKKTIQELTDKITAEQQTSQDLKRKTFELLEEKNKLIPELEVACKDLNSARLKVDELQGEIKSLRDDLDMCKKSSLSNQAGLQKTIQDLQARLRDNKEVEDRQQIILNKDLTRVKEENFEMKTSMKELEKEIYDGQLEINKLSDINKELRMKYAEEGREKRSLEGQRDVLENELNVLKRKLEQKTSEMLKAETGRVAMEMELEEKRSQLRKLESSLKEKQFENNTLMTERDSLKERVAGFEAQISRHHQQVDSLRNELEQATQQLEETVNAETSLQARLNEIAFLKKKISAEQKNSLVLAETVRELESQVVLLENEREGHIEKYKDLSAVVSAKEESVVAMRNQQREALKQFQHSDNEFRARELQEKVDLLEREKKTLTVDLMHRESQIDDLKKKYDERKIQAFTKLQALRQRYTREQKSFETLISQLQNNLTISLSRAEKEGKWKKETEASQKKILDDKNILVTKLASAEEQLRDARWELRQLKLSQSMLQEENYDSMQKLQLALKERQNLERCLRELIEREMFGAPRQRSDLHDSKLIVDAYLNTLKPGAGLGPRPSPGPGEPSTIRRGPDGRVAAANMSYFKSRTGSGLASPVEE